MRCARPHLVGKVTHSDLHERCGITHGLDILLIVAGVPPTAVGRDVGKIRGAEGLCRRHIVDEVIVIERWSHGEHGVLIFQMPGGCAQCIGDEVWPVPLCLVEEKRVDQQSGVKNLREVDSKRGRLGAYRSRD